MGSVLRQNPIYNKWRLGHRFAQPLSAYVWLGYALVLQPRHSTTLRYELRGATIALRRSFLTLALSCLASSPLRAGLPLAVEAAGLKVTRFRFVSALIYEK